MKDCSFKLRIICVIRLDEKMFRFLSDCAYTAVRFWKMHLQ